MKERINSGLAKKYQGVLSDVSDLSKKYKTFRYRLDFTEDFKDTEFGSYTYVRNITYARLVIKKIYALTVNKT